MVTKVECAVIVGSVVVCGIVLAKQSAAAPAIEIPEEYEIAPPVEIPFNPEELKEKIAAAKNLSELDDCFEEISSLFVNMEISYTEYLVLYQAYKARWYELGE